MTNTLVNNMISFLLLVLCAKEKLDHAREKNMMRAKIVKKHPLFLFGKEP